jgi:hypothetical protein
METAYNFKVTSKVNQINRFFSDEWFNYVRFSPFFYEFLILGSLLSACLDRQSLPGKIQKTFTKYKVKV